jgi:two-component sensor histidine kinase
VDKRYNSALILFGIGFVAIIIGILRPITIPNWYLLLLFILVAAVLCSFLSLANKSRKISNLQKDDLSRYLHDNVLQTLALIEKVADDSEKVRKLARAQESELRDFLYQGGKGRLSTENLPIFTRIRLVTEAMQEESGTEVTIDTDTEGVRAEELVIDENIAEEITAAFTECLKNAIRHGKAPINVYQTVERISLGENAQAGVNSGRVNAQVVGNMRDGGAVGVGVVGSSSGRSRGDMRGGVSSGGSNMRKGIRLQVFVRDHGNGFNVDKIPNERFGVKKSIISRMEQLGGEAIIKSKRKWGTEIELCIEL